MAPRHGRTATARPRPRRIRAGNDRWVPHRGHLAGRNRRERPGKGGGRLRGEDTWRPSISVADGGELAGRRGRCRGGNPRRASGAERASTRWRRYRPARGRGGAASTGPRASAPARAKQPIRRGTKCQEIGRLGQGRRLDETAYRSEPSKRLIREKQCARYCSRLPLAFSRLPPTPTETPLLSATVLATNRLPAQSISLRGRLRSQGAGSRLRFGWARRCSVRRITASLTMVSETSGSSSYSLARRRHLPSQPSVLSATQRRGRRTKPVLPASRRTMTRVSPSRKQASRAASRS